ncbi:hypothetical protein HF669_10175 [Acidithiobacillus thiooxidans]|uniref:hypothetical protein n=1 Tax=Acidithiobacillus thiooxidans TaxID=930 RepID=UPI001145DB6A|nr:hypothetical protein [Acidithiobacillus thiooxidans]MBU2811721.1 hypothetical protein [Acidithiobacillus thiooxidans]
MTHKTPTEIAREALKRLMELGLSPIPENYTQYYHEISGAHSTPEINWQHLMRRFCTEWERSQAGLSHLQKILAKNQLLDEKKYRHFSHKNGTTSPKMGKTSHTSGKNQSRRNQSWCF